VVLAAPPTPHAILYVHLCSIPSPYFQPSSSLTISAKMYLEDMDDDHKNIVERMRQEMQELKESQKAELESLLLESENLQEIHEKEKTELTLRFQDMVQDLRKRDEEVIKVKLLESINKKEEEFSEVEKVRGMMVDLSTCCIVFMKYTAVSHYADRIRLVTQTSTPHLLSLPCHGDLVITSCTSHITYTHTHTLHTHRAIVQISST
jgi:uncharacterized membrane protein